MQSVQTTNAMDDNLPLSMSHSASDSIDVRTGTVRPEATDSGQAPLTLAPLKSVQPYRTQDEFLVAMKEDLAEWLNSVYDLDMDENSLFAHLATGVLLCRHANAFNAVAATTPDPGLATSRRNSGISSSASWSNPSNPGSSLSTSGACPTITSGSSGSASAAAPFSAAVPFRESVQPGSFQSRDNIANFLRWCRHSLRLRDTLLFETEDLVQGRNERNVVLCLLEVARRGSRIGMAAPSLVRLEAEIDAEIARDEEAAASRLMLGIHEEEVSVAKCDDDLHGNATCVNCHGNEECNHDNAGRVLLQTTGSHGNDVVAVDGGKTRDAAVQTIDEAMMMEAASSPPPASSRHHPTFLHRKSSLESISSSSDSSSVRGGHAHPHTPHHHAHHQHHSVQQAVAAAAAAAASRQRRPVIEVDMMSLDEMVRNILNKCTCEFQYPMVRVSEGKYKIGDSLTLIFVRILRNHVMVRIGGGWDTLENYLHRHDPCRMETRVTKSSSGHQRIGAHACGGVGTSGTGVGGSGVGVTGEGWKDGSIPCDTLSKATNDRGSIEENPVLETSVGCTLQQNDLMSNRPDVAAAINEVPILISNQADDLAPRDTVVSSQQSSLPTSISDCDEADRSTGTTLPEEDGRRTRDVACQTDDPTRRYSSSSGASSWESASRDERCGRVGLAGRIDVTLDVHVPAQRDIDPTSPNSRIEDSDCSSTDPVSSRQDYTPEQDSSGQGSTGKPAPSGLGCPQCGQSAASGKQTAGLCRLCRQRRGQLRPASAKVTHQMPSSTASHAPGQTAPCLGSVQDKRFRSQRPASAQEKTPRRLPVPDSEGARLGVTPRAAAVSATQRPSSAQGQRPRAVGGSASSSTAQKQRRRTLGPAVIQEHMTLISTPSSTPNQLTRTVGHTLGQESLIRDQRRNSLGPASTPGQLHQTLTPGTTQVLLLDQLRPPRQQRTQRPASAQENRRYAKRSKPEEELLIVESSSSPRSTRRGGENTASGFSPAGFSHRPSTLTLPPSTAATTKTKSQEDLVTKEYAATNRLSPGSQTPGHRQRPASARSTISTQGDRQLIRELCRMKKLDPSATVGCTYDIPELTELPSEDPLPRPGSALGSSGGLQTRPRRDPAVGRSGSFSKIPKPAVMN